jgi:hypothetical protein
MRNDDIGPDVPEKLHDEVLLAPVRGADLSVVHAQVLMASTDNRRRHRCFLAAHAGQLGRLDLKTATVAV